MHTNPKGLIAVVFGTSCAQPKLRRNCSAQKVNLNILNKICTYDPMIYSNIACFYAVGVGKTTLTENYIKHTQQGGFQMKIIYFEIN